MNTKSIQTIAIEKLAKVIYKSFAKFCADNNMKFDIDPKGDSWKEFANVDNIIDWPRLYCGGPLVVKGENFEYSFYPEQALRIYKKFCQIDGVKPIKYDDQEIMNGISQKIEYDCTAIKKFMGKDPVRPAITGIYYDGGVAYATDTYKLMATPAIYPESLEGKIADKSQNIIDAKPLFYKHVFSNQEDTYKQIRISKKHGYNYTAIVSAITQANIIKSEYKDTRSCINICGVWYNTEHIQTLLDLAKTNDVLLYIGTNYKSIFSVYKKGVRTAVGAISEMCDQSMSIYGQCIAVVNYDDVQLRPLELLESIQPKNDELQQVEPTTELHINTTQNTVETTETALSQKAETDTTADSQKADSDGDNISTTNYEPTAENCAPIKEKRNYFTTIVPQRTFSRACCAILLLILLNLSHETTSRWQCTNRHKTTPYIANLARCAPCGGVGIIDPYKYPDGYQQAFGTTSAQLRHIFGLCSATLAATPQAATKLCRIYLVPYQNNGIAVIPTIKKRAYNSGFG